MSVLLQIITAPDTAARDRSLESAVRDLDADQLLSECRQLDLFRRECGNLYERVRALFFLNAIYRFHLPAVLVGRESGTIPFGGYEHLLSRRFPEAIDSFLLAQTADGPTITLSSALAEAYHQLAFQTLADQVRRSVRTVRGNQWMFRTGHPADVPLRMDKSLLRFNPATRAYPVLRERTSVRMDFSHRAGATSSSWGWTFRKVLGSSMPRWTWLSADDTSNLNHQSMSACVSSTNRSCDWSAST